MKGSRGDDGQIEKKSGGGMTTVAKQYAFKDPVNKPPLTQPHANDHHHLMCQIHNSLRSSLFLSLFTPRD